MKNRIIDLSNQKKITVKTEEDPPLGIQMLLLAPFAALLWWVFTTGFINGIY